MWKTQKRRRKKFWIEISSCLPAASPTSRPKFSGASEVAAHTQGATFSSHRNFALSQSVSSAISHYPREERARRSHFLSNKRREKSQKKIIYMRFERWRKKILHWLVFIVIFTEYERTTDSSSTHRRAGTARKREKTFQRCCGGLCATSNTINFFEFVRAIAWALSRISWNIIWCERVSKKNTELCKKYLLCVWLTFVV